MVRREAPAKLDRRKKVQEERVGYEIDNLGIRHVCSPVS